MYEIYITTNLKNGKKYIGQHKLTKKYDYYLGSGKILKQAMKKYKYTDFKKEQLELCETFEEANEREKYWIKYYNAVEDNNFYNLSEGGQGGTGFLYFRENLKKDPEKYKEFEEKRINGIKKWRQNNQEKLKESGKQNIKKCHNWIKEHPEEMQKVYDSQREENINRLNNWKQNNPEQYQANLLKGQEALKKWKIEHPEEVKKNLALGPQANKEKNGKKVKCTTTGEIFASIREAEKAYGIYKDGVGRCLRGVIKTAGKHPQTKEKLHWEYLEE